VLVASERAHFFWGRVRGTEECGPGLQGGSPARYVTDCLRPRGKIIPRTGVPRPTDFEVAGRAVTRVSRSFPDGRFLADWGPDKEG